MSELFDTSAFSSKNEIRGSTDSAWDDGSAFPELSSLRDPPSRSLEWVVGDRCQIITPKKYSGEKGYVCGFHADDSPEIWVKLDNHDLQIRVNPDEARFLEEKSKCQVIPENFLEETKEDTKRSPSSKRRQRKGCLYKYLENKKLKDGSIASYPRVIGHRHPDNPTHWRWGFNWEEKVDGEWKGRSIGSVPLGAIALIQSMQNEGVSLEEIIGFIRRAKAKK